MRRREAERGDAVPSGRIVVNLNDKGWDRWADHGRRGPARLAVVALLVAAATVACSAPPPAVPEPLAAVAAEPTPAPTHTPRPTYAPLPTRPPTNPTAAASAQDTAGPGSGGRSVGDDAAYAAAQARLVELARATFGDQLRSARLERMSQRIAANEAMRGRFPSVRTPGRPLITYATIAFNYGPYGDGRALLKGLSRNFESLAPQVFGISEVEQFELVAYVNFREPSGRYESVAGAMMAISRETAQQIDWTSTSLDWDKIVRQRDPLRNVLFLDSRLASPATP
ncbi:MAG TPA: hypothetical protein VFE37_26975 [Chloroflexota bacterium]|nr:hypothetical protein [Chloroflexota bacterium]